MKTTLREEVDHLAAWAEKTTLDQGKLIPMLLLVGEDMTHIVAIAFDLQPSGRRRIEQFARLGKYLAEQPDSLELGALRFLVHATEAWGKVIEQDDPIPSSSLAQDPERIEVLVLSALDVTTGEGFMRHYPMVRNDHQELVALGPAEELPAEPHLLEAFKTGYLAVHL